MKKLILSATLALGVPCLQGADDPRALMLQARERQREGENGDPRGAAALYRRVIELQPESAEAHLRLSECLMEAGDLQGAAAPAQRATELAPRNAEAWAHLGILRSALAQTKPEVLPLAELALQKATQLLPQDVELWYRLGEVCEANKHEAEALRAWVHLGRLHPSLNLRGKVLGDLAWERAAFWADRLKRYEPRREAIMALASPLEADPKYLKLLEDLAREQADQGFLGHAEESFLLLGQHLPQEPGIWENIALVRLRASNFSGALQSLNQAEALKGTPRNSYYTALCLMNLGRIPEAETRLMAILKASQDRESKAFQTTARELLAACTLMTERPQETLDLVRSWAPESESSPRLQSLAFVAEVRLGQLKTARTRLREGLKRFKEEDVFGLARTFPIDLFEDRWSLGGDARRALRSLEREASANHLAYFQRWEACLKALQEARKIAPPRSIDLMLLQANALDQLGRWKESLEVLREGQRLSPDNPTLQNNLGYLLIEHEGNQEEAARLIQAALKQEPDNGSTLDSWGWLLFKQGRFQEAETSLRKAAELNPYSPETRKHLGEVLLKLGRDQEALEQWERALAHAFPERRELELKVRDLKIRIGKQAAAVASPDDTDESLDDEEEELP
ncbi:MAG: Flp pilus assembly protein TadD, contains repeat [Holophagaceae bacterium]|nr:Flp pilus assembly protein TadD, contains repeat [Holophagaceae bacterium]